MKNGSKEFCSEKTHLTNPQVYLQPSCCMVIPYRTLSPVTNVLYHEVGMTKNFELTGKQQKEKKLEKYYNRGTRNLEQLKVNDPVCIQNNRTKRWDGYGWVMECYQQSRRYLIKLESGLMIRQNIIHLRKRYSHPKNDINSTEPSNYLDDDDVKNNEPNDGSDDEVGNNFN